MSSVAVSLAVCAASATVVSAHKPVPFNTLTFECCLLRFLHMCACAGDTSSSNNSLMQVYLEYHVSEADVLGRQLA